MEPVAGPLAGLAIAEAVCARLCHDLSGGLGSLSMLLDMAVQSSGGGGELLGQSLQTAREVTARLSFLRAAWTTSGEAMSVPKLRALAAGRPSGRRVTIDLAHLDDTGVFSPGAARTMLNLILLGAESLPRGGALSMSGEASGAVLATIQGPNAAWPESLAPCLADPAEAARLATDPRRVQAPLTALVAHAAGLTITILQPVGSGDMPAPLLLDCSGAR